MPSPTKESLPSVPSIAPPTVLYPPPSPSTHRTLRKLQSAHNLGAKAGNISSILSQQRFQPLQLRQQQQPQQQSPSQSQPQPQPQPQPQLHQLRPASPTRRNVSGSNRSPQRARANSDAMTLQQISSGAATPSRRPLLGRSPALDSLSLDRLIRDGPPDGDVVGALNNLRWKILETGIKSDGDGMSSARIYAWLILLDCPVLETDAYLSLVHRGASPAYSKIRNDTFRTLTTDPLFRRRVSEASLIRLLNAIAWKLHDAREKNASKHPHQQHPHPHPHQHGHVSHAGHSLARPTLQRPLLPPPTTRQSLPATQSLTSPFDTPTKAAATTTVTTATATAVTAAAAAAAAATSSASATTTTTTLPLAAIESGSSRSGPSSPAAKNRARALTLTTEGSETSVSAEPGTYVQGMNVLAAPFLYAARSEAEAFVAFHHLLTKECPGYIRGAMDGVHKGLALVDKVLAIVDSRLSLYLLSKNLSAEIYAFPSVLTLCACTPPLPEVLRLWDFLFAYGPHLNILCIVAQLMLIRNQILTSPSPNKLLRSFPALQADAIKGVTLTIIRKLPADVYTEIVNHAL